MFTTLRLRGSRAALGFAALSISVLFVGRVGTASAASLPNPSVAICDALQAEIASERATASYLRRLEENASSHATKAEYAAAIQTAIVHEIQFMHEYAAGCSEKPGGSKFVEPPKS